MSEKKQADVQELVQELSQCNDVQFFSVPQPPTRYSHLWFPAIRPAAD